MAYITFLTASGHKIAISPKRSKSTFTIFQDGLIAESCLDEKDVSYEVYRIKRGYRSRQLRSQIRIVRSMQEQLDRVDDGLFAKLDEGLLSLAAHPIFPRSKPKCFKWFLGDLRLAAATHYSVVYAIDRAANLRILRVRFSKWKPPRKARTLAPKPRKSPHHALTRNDDGRRLHVQHLKRTDRFVGYSGETAEELFSYPAEDQYDSLVQGFREGIQKKAARKRPRPLTAQERVVLAVTALEQEVNSGGFDQFFRSASRKFAPQIVLSLLSIKCSRMAKIAQSAIAALRISSLHPKKIEKAMATQSDERDRKLDRCDQLFYKAQTQQSVSSRLYGFIKTNKTHIDF